MRQYILTNCHGDIVVTECDADGTESNMTALADKYQANLAKSSFVHLVDGQSLVLRAQIYVPDAA